MSKEYSDVDDFASDEEEDNQVLITGKDAKKNVIQFDQEEDEEEQEEEDEEVQDEEEPEDKVVQLTEQQIEKEKQRRLKKLA